MRATLEPNGSISGGSRAQVIAGLVSVTLAVGIVGVACLVGYQVIPPSVTIAGTATGAAVLGFMLALISIFLRGKKRLWGFLGMLLHALLFAGCGLITIGLAILLPDPVRANGPVPPTPKVELGSVFWPHFSPGDLNIRAGTCFIARFAERPEPLLLTALHLFGPSGGHPAQIPRHELGGRIRLAELTSIETGNVMVVRLEAIVSSSSDPYGYSALGDYAGFRLAGESGLSPLRLSETPPRRGDHVWLIARDSNKPGQLLHHAVVQANDEDGMTYYFDSPVRIRGTSGAPVIDATGEVVAINLGGGEWKWRTFGYGNPIHRIGPSLRP